MSRTSHLRKVFWIIVIGWAGSSGCIHNHYYGTGVPGCLPGQAVTTQVGPVCDVPSGNVIVSGTNSAKVINSNVGPQPSSVGTGITQTMPGDRVVISQPAFGPPSIGQVSNRIKSPWKRPDPETLPIIKAEGAYDETTIR